MANAELLARIEEPGPALMNASVSRPWLLTEPKAVQRRVLKAIGERAAIPLEFKHVERSSDSRARTVRRERNCRFRWVGRLSASRKQ